MPDLRLYAAHRSDRSCTPPASPAAGQGRHHRPPWQGSEETRQGCRRPRVRHEDLVGEPSRAAVAISAFLDLDLPGGGILARGGDEAAADALGKRQADQVPRRC